MSSYGFILEYQKYNDGKNPKSKESKVIKKLLGFSLHFGIRYIWRVFGSFGFWLKGGSRKERGSWEGGKK